MAPTEQKALTFAAPGKDFEVTTRPVPTPGAGQVLVKVHATGLNPVDEFIRRMGFIVTVFPAVIGCEASGTIEGLGEGVTGLQVGDRVLFQGWFVSDRSTYQQYALSDAATTAKIPENISFDDAAAIPATLATAAMGLYAGKADQERSGASLSPVWEEGGKGKYKDQPILIIGGAGNVGQYAIQLAKLSGFSPIITTASAANVEYAKAAGATHVIDYKSTPYSDLPSQVSSITGGKPIKIIYDTIAKPDTSSAGFAILKAGEGGNLIVTGNRALGEGIKLGKTEDGKIEVHYVAGTVNFPTYKKIGSSLYEKLPALLASGEIKPNNVEVLPGGLIAVQQGLGRIFTGKAGARKLVVRPQETA